MKITKAQYVMGIVCVLLGFMVTLQLRSVSFNRSIKNAQTLRNDELEKELNSQRTLNEDLAKQVEQLTGDIDNYRREAAERSTYASAINEQLNRAEILAGLAEVSGPGVLVKLNDSSARGPGNSADFIIHDDDLRKVVNELFAAGAEAISLNNERIIATTAIRCVGPVVFVNSNKHSVPFTIKAIGNPETLEAALNLRDGVVDILRNLWKIEIEISKEKSITVPRYGGAVNFNYAQPVRGGVN